MLNNRVTNHRLEEKERAEVQAEIAQLKELIAQLNELNNLEESVNTEVTECYTPEEIAHFEHFEAFWDAIDVQNAYEEDWDKWQGKGIKETYKIVFDKLRGKQ